MSLHDLTILLTVAAGKAESDAEIESEVGKLVPPGSLLYEGLMCDPSSTAAVVRLLRLVGRRP